MGEKIFASNGKVVGEVVGSVFYKTFKGSRHMLRKPRAIANDVDVLDQAESCGAVEVQERDTETGSLYCTTIEAIRAHGFQIDRGYGPQIALALSRWSLNGQPAALVKPSDGQPVDLTQPDTRSESVEVVQLSFDAGGQPVGGPGEVRDRERGANNS